MRDVADSNRPSGLAWGLVWKLPNLAMLIRRRLEDRWVERTEPRLGSEATKYRLD